MARASAGPPQPPRWFPAATRDPEDDRQRELATLSPRRERADPLRCAGPDQYVVPGVEYGPPIDGFGESLFAVSDAAEASSTLADSTGARDPQLERPHLRSQPPFDTMTTYHLIGYRAPGAQQAGLSKHQVEARVSGLHVLARRGYFDEAGAARYRAGLAACALSGAA